MKQSHATLRALLWNITVAEMVDGSEGRCLAPQTQDFTILTCSPMLCQKRFACRWLHPCQVQMLAGRDMLRTRSWSITVPQMADGLMRRFSDSTHTDSTCLMSRRTLRQTWYVCPKPQFQAMVMLLQCGRCVEPVRQFLRRTMRLIHPFVRIRGAHLRTWTVCCLWWRRKRWHRSEGSTFWTYSRMEVAWFVVRGYRPLPFGQRVPCATLHRRSTRIWRRGSKVLRMSSWRSLTDGSRLITQIQTDIT
mmetsp:Transcript_55949/g.149215  ORF Transcript_55949/g.149215 Transcript_55949/m.149215 type:complete len:248 (-) Transcript_55949:1443-2186(-)